MLHGCIWHTKVRLHHRHCNTRLPRGGTTLVMSYTSTHDPDCQVNWHSNASKMISGHQKLPVCWVHSGWGVFSTMLKLSIRSRLIAAVHLALNSHINAVWKSQNCSARDGVGPPLEATMQLRLGNQTHVWLETEIINLYHYYTAVHNNVQ